MKVLPTIVHTMLILVVALYCGAQTQGVKSNLVARLNGVNLGKMNRVMEDKYGFIWLSDQINECIFRLGLSFSYDIITKGHGGRHRRGPGNHIYHYFTRLTL